MRFLEQVVNKEFVQRHGDMVFIPGQQPRVQNRWNAWTAEATLRTAFNASPSASRPHRSVAQPANDNPRPGPHVAKPGAGGQVLDAKVMVTKAALAHQCAA